MANEDFPGTLSLDARLALAQEAVRDFGASCFWNWKKDAVINEAALPEVAAQLRMHGGRKGFLLAAQLCPSPLSRKKFFDFSANIATRRVT